MPRRRASVDGEVLCREEDCRLPIVPCRGAHGRWMHEGTRSEFCANEERTLAKPLRLEDLSRR